MSSVSKEGQVRGTSHTAEKGSSLLMLNRARVVGLAVWSFVCVLQAVIWASGEAVECAALAIAGGVAGLSYALRRGVLREFPISVVMIVGYAVYYFLLPPLATLAEFKPLTSNLDHPVLVFTHALVGLVTILLAHAAYRLFGPLQGLRGWVSERVYRPIGYFTGIGNKELLVMGVVGLGAMAYQVLVAGAAQQDVLGAGNKLMQALYPLAYLPFLILLKGGVVAVDTRRSPGWLVLLGGYTVALLLVAMARNGRSAFLLGFASVGIVYGYALAAGLVSNRYLRSRYVVPLLVIGIALIGPVSDLATSMVIVRSQRADVSPTELLQDTLKTFEDKGAIEARRLEDSGAARDWDERYVDNLFMARLSNLKFTDNSLGLALRMGNSQRETLRGMEWQRVWSILPRPVLEHVAPWVDKDTVSGASGGDLMLYTVTHNRYALGGFRTGSLLGSAWALFGRCYPLALFVVLLPLFALADAQTSARRLEERVVPVLAPMAAVSFFTWFFYLTSAATGVEAFSDLPEYLLRGWIQTALIWALTFWIARILARVSFGRAAS